MSDNSIVLNGYGESSSKTMSIKNIKFVDANKISFKPSEIAIDSFDISHYILLGFDAKECLTVCSSTMELKDAVKKHSFISRKMSADGGPVEIKIVRFLKSSQVNNVMSLNRFIAVCSGRLTSYKFGTFYNTEEKKYVTRKEKVDIGGSSINRLAEKIGIPKESMLYWLYLPGVENLYKVYPCEVMAICSWRALNPEKSGIKQDIVEMVRSLATKIAINGSLHEVDMDKVHDYYKELDSCIHRSASTMRAEKFAEQIKSMFSKKKSKADLI